ncbi:MAG TPA: chloride channel protein [Dehalococcoidia bacterium]|nr:chloride channel protein [Dehalococcoidia bacterium]
MRLPLPLANIVSRLRPSLLVAVVAVGIAGGLIGAAYVSMLHLLQRGLWPTHYATAEHLGILVAAGVTIGLITYLLGMPGNVELLVDNIHVLGGPQDLRDLRALIPVSLLSISAGGALGPEAPLVQSTGAVGAWFARQWRLTRGDTRTLAITGMAAGFTVLFGAPLGSALFALEILHRRGMEYYEALVPALLGSIAGLVVYVLFTGFGFQPIWTFPSPGTVHMVDFGWALLAGAGGAGIAIAFTYANVLGRRIFAPIPPVMRPLLGGIILGLLAFWSPYALTYGESQVNPLVARDAVASVFIVAVIAKFLGATVTQSSGWRGGFIIPLFFIGTAMGRLCHIILPNTNEVVLMAAFMAACVVGVTKTTLGSTLVATEMAGLQILPTTLLAALVALFLTSSVTLIETQRDREREIPGEIEEDGAMSIGADRVPVVGGRIGRDVSS